MENEKFVFSSKAIDLSENDEKNYMELTSRLCYYGEPNLNGVLLPIDGANEAAKTLIDMPVVAKYQKSNKNGKLVDDLGSHEAHRNYKTNDIEFGTESIGTHVSVEIKPDTIEFNGECKTLPCLFATAKIWKRNKNVCNAIQRLYQDGNLHSSWEINAQDFVKSNGIKTLNKYCFTANCLLGSGVIPAYPCADALSLSSASLEKDPELLIAEALYQDINPNKKEENMKNNDEKEDVSLKDIQTENSDTSDVSSTSESVCKDPKKKDSESVCKDPKKKDSESVCGDPKKEEDKSVCGDPKKKETADSDKSANSDDSDKKCGSIDSSARIAALEEKVSSLSAALASANAEIQKATSVISSLKVYKDMADKAEAEKKEAELEQQRADLKSYALSSTLISEKEIEDSESDVAKFISEANRDGIDKIIASRFMDSLNSAEKESVKKVSTDYATAIDTKTNEQHLSKNIIKVYLDS